jgi:hypothetical protein
VVLSHQEPYNNPLLDRAHHSILCTLACIQYHQLHHCYSHFHHYSTILSFRMLVILTRLVQIFKILANKLSLLDTPSSYQRRVSWDLVPANTRSGDRIYIILGADVPYVVRETERDCNFILIRESYIVGLMHGEAMKDFSKYRDKETLILVQSLMAPKLSRVSN